MVRLVTRQEGMRGVEVKESPWMMSGEVDWVLVREAWTLSRLVENLLW